ncbi:unnamed protein product [Lathyrus oleraceus]
MGCCISKCKPNKTSLDQFNKHLQDKLVISHQHHQLLPSHSPTTTTTTLVCPSTKISPSPLSPPSPTSSISSFTCTTSSNTISSSSSNSLSSLSSKDRSFSNEFLWSCYKENPHIITRINSLAESSPLSFVPAKPKKIINPSPPKQNMPQKRVRSNSPTNLTRQKSFRKEVELPMRPNRMTGSPSPSRRFNGGALSTTISDKSVSRRMSNNSTNVSVSHYSRSVNSSSSIKKESVKASISSPNPNNSLRRIHSSGLNLRQREAVVSCHNHNMDSTIMEDVDNPLISLDCFIFL